MQIYSFECLLLVLKHVFEEVILSHDCLCLSETMERRRILTIGRTSKRLLYLGCMWFVDFLCLGNKSVKRPWKDKTLHTR